MITYTQTQTRKTANWLAEKMTKDGHAVAVLSGELTVEQRISVLDRFRAGLEKVLITTNVLARGDCLITLLPFKSSYEMHRVFDFNGEIM